MGSSLIVIPGLTDDDKVPEDYGYTQFNVGGMSGSNPLPVLYVGNKLAAGSRADETGPWPVFSEADADAQCGAGSELARMCYAGLKVDGASIYVYPVTEAAGATAGIWVLTHTGTPVGSGQVTLRIGGKSYVYTTVTSAQTCSDNAAAAINSDARQGWTASVGGAPNYDVTITTRQKSIRAGQYWAKIDTSLSASGVTAALFGVLECGDVSVHGTGATGLTAAGTPLTSTQVHSEYRVEIRDGGDGTRGSATFDWYTDGGVTAAATGVTTGVSVALSTTGVNVTFQASGLTAGQYWDFDPEAVTHNDLYQCAGGAGTDDVTTALAALAGAEWGRICFAENDAVNEAAYETHVDGEAATTIGHLEHVVIGHNGTSATATTLANTTCNSYRVELIWSGYQAVSPVEWAAEFAAHRAVTEQTNPNPNYDNYVFKTMVPLETADIPNHATLKALLNNGVSPVTMKGSDPVMCRAIVTHCLNGTAPDYGTLDTGDATTPDRVRQDLCAKSRARRALLPYAGPDPADGIMLAQTETPNLWRAEIALYQAQKIKLNWLDATEVAAHPPRVEWDTQTKRIMSAIPCPVKAHNHQYGILVQQLSQ